MGNPVNNLSESAKPATVVPADIREHRPTVMVPALHAPFESAVQFFDADPGAEASQVDEGWLAAEATPSVRLSARPTERPSLRPTRRVPDAGAPAAAASTPAAAQRKSGAAQRGVVEGGYSQIVARRRSA